MPAQPFNEIVSSEAQLREILGMPSEMVVKKCMPSLDKNCKIFIAHSPFVLLSTATAEGRCDVSPRGDRPGFVHVLDDHTLLLPDRPGNKRIDSLLNLVSNPRAGLLFVIPGVEDTLRVNGRATIVRDPELMEAMVLHGKTPKLAVAVETEEVFFHCAKAFKRSSLWNPSEWPDSSGVPTLAQIIVDQFHEENLNVEAVTCDMEEAYRTNLY